LRIEFERTSNVMAICMVSNQLSCSKQFWIF